MTAARATDATTEREWRRALAKRNPHFVSAVLADAKYARACRGKPLTNPTRRRLAFEAIRLAVVSDAFIGLMLYRGKARLQALGIPFLPYVADRLAIVSSGVSIGSPVFIEPGIYLPHGQVVIDGSVTIAAGTAIRPWVTIGLIEGNFQGATIGRGVRIGTGAKILGPVTIGERAKIGANAVVTLDVPADATAVGVPARVIEA